MHRSSPLLSALNMCASAKECHHPHPTPPHPIPCDVCACDSGWKKWCKIVPVCACDSSLCARVTLENGCARTWLQSVCAGDSGSKKWCKIVAVCTCDSRVCARVTPWPNRNACSKLDVVHCTYLYTKRGAFRNQDFLRWHECDKFSFFVTGVGGGVGGPWCFKQPCKAASSSRRSPRWGLKGLVWGHQLLGLVWWYGGFTFSSGLHVKTRCFTRTIAFKSAWSWCNTEHGTLTALFQLDEPYLILVLKCRRFSSE